MIKNFTIGSILFVMLQLFMAFNCTKEHSPKIQGHWETVTTVGFAWEYNIERDGDFCRSLEEYFPGTEFCHKYTEDGNITYVAAQNPEVWTWEFECENVALVTVVAGIDTDSTFSQTQQFILRRK